MAWWSYFMATHPEVLDRVADEARDVLNEQGDSSTIPPQLEHDDLARFSYTRATLQVRAILLFSLQNVLLASAVDRSVLYLIFSLFSLDGAQETLRMRPPVGHIIRRVARESEVIAGHHVPQGAITAVTLMYIQNCSRHVAPMPCLFHCCAP
jgi:cytochrome P450